MSAMQFWKLYSKAFVVADYEFDNGFSEFKMVNPIWRSQYFGNATIFMELCTPGLLRSLITNLTSDFHFSKWLEHKLKNCSAWSLMN